MPIHSARVRPFAAERPLMFAYYGTRGALPKLTLDLAREASGRWNNACTFSLATSNELYDEFSFMQDNLFAVNTFASPQQWQSIACVQRVKSLCADLSERVANDKTSRHCFADATRVVAVSIAVHSARRDQSSVDNS